MTSAEYLQRLHELLDGELPAEAEEGLFYALAADAELRAALRQLILVQRALVREQPSIPAQLEQQLFQRLGFAEQGIRQRWQTGAIAIGSALLGFALGALLSLRTPEPSASSSPQPSPAVLEMALPMRPRSTTCSAHAHRSTEHRSTAESIGATCSRCTAGTPTGIAHSYVHTAAAQSYRGVPCYIAGEHPASGISGIAPARGAPLPGAVAAEQPEGNTSHAELRRAESVPERGAAPEHSPCNCPRSRQRGLPTGLLQ